MGKRVSFNSSSSAPDAVRSGEVKGDWFGKMVTWFRGDSNSKHAKNAKRVLTVFIASVLCATVVGIIPVVLAGLKWSNLSRRETQTTAKPSVLNAAELIESFVILKPTTAEKNAAIALWVEKYREGDTEALHALKDFAKNQYSEFPAISLKAYKAAAELGDAEAQAIVGDWLRKEYPGKKPSDDDLSKGLEYIEMSAAKKHPLGLYYLAKYYETTISDSVKAKKIYKKAVKRGSPEAMARLGNAYELGHLGFKKNLKRAFKYYDKGAVLDDFVCVNGRVRLLVNLTNSEKEQS